jgi:hypothetical protein
MVREQMKAIRSYDIKIFDEMSRERQTIRGITEAQLVVLREVFRNHNVKFTSKKIPRNWEE